MTLEFLIEALSPLGLPIAKNQFKRATVPPFIIVQATKSRGFFADNARYKRVRIYKIILVTPQENSVLQGKLEQLMDSVGVLYESDGMYIDTERIYQVTYEFEDLEG